MFPPFQQSLQQWRTVASLWRLLSKSFQKSPLRTSYPHGRPSVSSGPVEGQAGKQSLSREVKTQKKAHRKRAEQPGAEASEDEKETQVAELKKATPAVFTKPWPHHALCYQWGCNSHTDTPPSCLSLLVVNFPLTSPFKGPMWGFHAFCHKKKTNIKLK